MELWLWVIVGGLVGTVLMYLTAIAAEKLNITSGGRCGGPQAIGRWVLGLFDACFDEPEGLWLRLKPKLIS